MNNSTNYAAVCRKLLFPVVKVLLRNGISFQQFTQWVKGVFVDAAKEVLAEENKKASVSALAVITGINRKELGLLAKSAEDNAEAKLESAYVNRAIRVVTAWNREDIYLDNGSAKILPVVVDDASSEHSFASLCDQFGGSVTYRSVLNELLRLNMVEVSEAQGVEHVKLLKQHFVPDGDQIEVFKQVGVAGSDLLNTITHNMDHKDHASRLQLSVAYDQLPDETIREFKKLSERKAVELLNELDGWLADKVPHHVDESKEGCRAGFGMYFFTDDTRDEG